MHILIFCEQHPHTLGGAQTSVLLQDKFLERAGHTVTYVSPALRTGPLTDPKFIDLPSWSVPTVKEYTWLWPRDSHMDQIERELGDRPPVDIVHVQSDFWGAAFGYRFARQNGIPLVHTMHHRLDVGVDGSIPFPGAFYAMLGQWQKWSLGDRFVGRPRHAFDYLAGYAREADVVVSPSHHFAELLSSRGVTTKSGVPLTVIPTGVDDDVLDSLPESDHAHAGAMRVAWVGRFSPEKRIVEFCESLHKVTADVTVTMVGDGALRGKAEAAAPSFVQFTGILAYRDALATIADSDVLVQSSNDFETQGMTVTEALALGSHVIVVDKAIAAELPTDHVTLTRDLSDAAMAEAIDEVSRRRASVSRHATNEERAQYRQSSRTAEMISVYKALA